MSNEEEICDCPVCTIRITCENLHERGFEVEQVLAGLIAGVMAYRGLSDRVEVETIEVPPHETMH